MSAGGRREEAEAVVAELREVAALERALAGQDAAAIARATAVLADRLLDRV